MINPTGALDLWTLLVEGVFGGFWIAVIGLLIMQFLIMGFMGKVSIYSCMIYMMMFILCMALGYGYVAISFFITLSMLIALYFSWKGYMDRGGQ